MQWNKYFVATGLRISPTEPDSHTTDGHMTNLRPLQTRVPVPAPNHTLLYVLCTRNAVPKARTEHNKRRYSTEQVLRPQYSLLHFIHDSSPDQIFCAKRARQAQRERKVRSRKREYMNVRLKLVLMQSSV